MNELERRFHRRLLRSVEIAKREYKYNPTRFLQLVGAKGPVGACKQLLEGDVPAEGFGTLFAADGHEALRESIEGIIATEREWHPLFDAYEVDQAWDRLEQVGFPDKRP